MTQRRSRPLQPLVAALALTVAALSAQAWAGDAKPVIVLELFTSQGCSSCPAADALLGKLAGRRDVVALSLPVDYWDYLGWRDTLASPIYSARQRTYAKTRGDHQVYTPQLVVNGMHHVNGADLSAIERAVATTKRELAGERVPLTLSPNGDTLKVEIGAAPGGAGSEAGVVWLALVKKAATVKVARGENGGRELTYHNVVRELVPVGRWSGEATTLRLPLCRQVRDDIDTCVVLVQQGMTGPILTAAQHSWK